MITPLWISHMNKWQKIYTVIHTLLTIFTLKGCENLTSIVAIIHKSCTYIAQLWQTSKTRQKLIEKFVKLMDHSCACNDLTSFEYEVHGMTGNGSYFNIAETCMKKFVKSLQVNLFLAGFSNLKLMCFVVHAVLQLACRLTELRSACMHSVTELITYLTTNPVWLSFFNFFAQISHQIVKITVDSHQELFDLTIFSFLFRVS